MRKVSTFIITICVLFQLLTFFSCKIENDSQQESSTPEVQLTAEQQRLIQELNNWLIPLGLSPLELTDNELSFLDRFGFARVVALGEATHGTRDFFQMKHRIFRYLVEHFNHKIFGFEADFGESIYLNNYVINGEGNLRELMKTVMHFWTWRTEEVLELLEWMKDYNIGKSDAEKIHYMGFDCQFFTYQPGLIRNYLEPILPALWEAFSPVLAQIQALPREEFANLTEQEYNTLKAQLESFEDQFAANRDYLIANSSLDQYRINAHLLRTFTQTFILYYSIYGNTNDNIDWRERFMAENVQWVADFFGDDTRITIWAHNGHVANDRDFYGDGSMGYHLREALGDLYQVLGFGFSQGYFTAVGRDSRSGMWTHLIDIEPTPDSINFLFHQATSKNFVFDLDTIPAGSEWDNWLSQPRPFMYIGALYNGNPSDYYMVQDVREFYNQIIYIDKTSNSRLISLE